MSLNPGKETPTEPAFESAQDAVEACARYAVAKLQPGLQMMAMKALDVAWEDAPNRKIIGCKRPRSGEELNAAMFEPMERWLPYARDLGVEGQCLCEGEPRRPQPTQVAQWMSAPRRR